MKKGRVGGAQPQLEVDLCHSVIKLDWKDVNGSGHAGPEATPHQRWRQTWGRTAMCFLLFPDSPAAAFLSFSLISGGSLRGEPLRICWSVSRRGAALPPRSSCCISGYRSTPGGTAGLSQRLSPWIMDYTWSELKMRRPRHPGSCRCKR